MDPVGPHGQNGPFSRSNKPRSRISTSFLPKIFIDVHLDLSYGASWPSRTKRLIFKVKQASKQSMDFLMIRNSNLIFVKNFHGRPLRP
ncbi:hypothetical protein H5410_058876 [Solanum commersonii]|uniref:Uncharacterized protein n=1 Tax=Solanum commersonii TaxID=4109 RepID=A0A9J5W1S5_SOLCO|nr:hypothetical protein H5410_058876 [Solanum commersonii]